MFLHFLHLEKYKSIHNEFTQQSHSQLSLSIECLISVSVVDNGLEKFVHRLVCLVQLIPADTVLKPRSLEEITICGVQWNILRSPLSSR